MEYWSINQRENNVVHCNAQEQEPQVDLSRPGYFS
jgi:hypothetical protein